MSSRFPVSESDRAAARATGFSECVITLRRALTTTPVGWLLAIWFCWGTVPQSSILLWLSVAAIVWAFSLWALQVVIGEGSSFERHRTRIHWVAGMDGLAWGLTTWFLMGHAPILDAMLMALLCGVIAVNAQAYSTYTVAYYRQIGTLLGVSVLGVLLHVADRKSATDYAAGLTVFVILIAYYTREISKRLLDGFQLQRANALLAQQLHLALRKVELDAATDALTGQGNRRALDEVLKHQAALYLSSGKSFSILLLDIDFFKTINDNFGHMIGDDVLRAFSQRVSEYLRPTDVCTRFGGEEFVVVLPGTTLEEAQEVAERLRLGVAQSPLLQTPTVQVTVSIGVATLALNQTVGDLLAAADASVYAAKKAGRNQVHPCKVHAQQMNGAGSEECFQA
ncbi:diguanylate cyclase [Telluria sp. B2]